jgi:TRAP-type C4-dicarboxylate transport system substrate-binding protein
MLLKPLSAVAIATALLAVSPALAQAIDGPKVSWRLGAWGKPRAATAGTEAIKKYVEEKTGGKFSITIGYESFGSPKELLDVLKVGGIEATSICSSYHPEKTPAYTGLDLPFLPLASFDAQMKLHEAYHKHPAILKEFEQWNARPWYSTVLPQYEFIGRGKAPKALDDFKGMRVRAIGGIGDAMKRLGAVPTSVDATEVYTALERGTVDAASFPSTYAHGSYKTFEIGKWYTENMSPGTQACPVLVNIEAHAKLPPQYQKLLEDGKPAAYEAFKQAYGAADAKFIPEFKKKGLAFVKFSEAELKEFRKIAAEPVWEEWVQKREAQGIPGRELLKFILDTATAAAKS